MSIAFVIPGHLRQFTGGRGQVLVEGGAASVSAALALLWAAHPAVRDRVLTELGEVRAHINVFVDGENIRNSGGLATPIRDGAEIVILPAISGGLPLLRVRRLPR
ncbi:MAG: MoaD/ThiS family protein [Acidobacteria bacterium]|nr:MoaD/ThiS family protein [Acidobacteriota bacterium]